MKKWYMLSFLICSISAHWQSLYNPARSAYMHKTWHGKKEVTVKKSDCVFCDELAQQNDEQQYIIKRFDHVYVCLNPFPYQHGHMLILPQRHVGSLDALTVHERAELMEVIAIAVSALKEAFNCDGANVGINIGKAAGASKPDHLHVQVVPRWFADTSWMHTIGQTAVVAVDMHQVYQQLKAQFDDH